MIEDRADSPTKTGPPSRRLTPTRVPGVFRRGNRYVVRFRDAQGRQRQRSAETLAEARRLKAALNADVLRGEHRELSRVSFGEYASTWADTYQGRTGIGVRPKTLLDYRRALELHAVPFFGRRRLCEIEPRDLKAFAKHVSDTGLAPATVRNLLAPVRALLATAVEDGLIRFNPSAGLRLAGSRSDTERAKALTGEELAALIEATADEWRLLVRFVAATGLRIGEVVGLRWEHMDLERQRVMVRERRYREQVDRPKSRYGRRDVPLGDGLTRELGAHRLATHYSRDIDPFFCTRRGTPHRPENLLRRVLKPAAVQAGVGWAGWHTLRHTCATSLFRAGANAKQVQVWLGHHSPAFTLAVYVHLLPDDLPSGAAMDALVGLGDAAR